MINFADLQEAFVIIFTSSLQWLTMFVLLATLLLVAHIGVYAAYVLILRGRR